MSEANRSQQNESNIYRRLGVNTIINAAGTFTEFGGSLMPPAVLTARDEAAEHFVDLRELQDAVGRRLAKLLQVEAAMVTAGAASSILLGTAAAITVRDPSFVEQHPTTPWEVLRQTSHRSPYDRQIEMCGARVVDVDTVEDAVRSVNERTVLMMSYNLAEPCGKIQHAEWTQLAKRLQLPTLIDAAADLPPLENIGRFTRMGYDLVAVSGGKVLRGPQASGLLLGRAELMAAAKQNATPNEGTVGRVAKVSKEDIVGLWQAVELLSHSGDDLVTLCDRRIRQLQERLEQVPTLTSCRIVPPIANPFPHLLIQWDEPQLGVTPADLKASLANAEPSIVTSRVDGTGSEGLLISVINLQDGEEDIVAERIAQFLSARRAQ